MKRSKHFRLTALILACVLALGLCACAPTDPPVTDEQPDQPTPTPPAEQPSDPTEEPEEPVVPVLNEDNMDMLLVPPTDLVDDAAYDRATQYNRNADLTRLQAVMNRAKAGEDIKVAVIGGSITAGSSSSGVNSHSYGAYFRDWWTDTFPFSDITLINAGIGATTSYLGVHRVQEDVIDKGADVCIIEFSVNDFSDSYYKQSYESLIARLLDNDIAVILLFMVKESGDSTQSTNVMSGITYQTPMLSYGDVVMPLIESGEITWRDISPDNIHPNDRGHAIVGELLWEYLNEVFAYAPDEVSVTPMREELLTQTKYFGAYMLDSTTLEPDTIKGFLPTSTAYSTFTNGWRTMSGGVIEFTATFSRMGAMYRRTTDGYTGNCEVYVDGKHVGTLKGDFSGGWGNYDCTEQFYSSRKSEQHTVRLVVEDGKAFTLVRLFVTE